ncbi:uncharacterized protein PV09_05148 [Verruconis gallopava]|uniref:RRM domain-containing protein n=1 Tax=Verruconis gallopava TaxID=253628 RepID=A0A0D2AXD6_9PEZI|nr:uncharacterized protein PV09_05148 [Verruconis gallopava]KIW03849.1 hypothetical protein PV09_05148 [Verruconis gallopava]
MTDKLPPNLLALFAPRPPLRYLPPTDHAPADRRTAYISSVADYLPALEEYKRTDVYHPTESHQQRKDRIKLEKQKKADWLTTEGVKQYKPSEDPKIEGDPLKTLFVARLSYDVTEKDLEQEFSRFGPVEKVRIVRNEYAPEDAPKKKKNRGYAFVVFEKAKDMTAAYKVTDGLRLKGRPILVDVERGRTVTNWRPRRLGGGLGGRGYSKAGPSRLNGAGNFNGPPSGPGGFRGAGFQGGRQGGGFRGDFGGGRSGGGFRSGRGSSGFGGPRGGVGYQSNGFGGAPDGAPAGPRGGSRPNGYGGGRSYDDRGYGGSGGSRSGGGGYRDRDQDGGYGGRDDSRKRRYDDGGSYDDRRSKPRH